MPAKTTFLKVSGETFTTSAVVLPHGYHYGRLEPEDAAPFMTAINRGEVYGVDASLDLTTWQIEIDDNVAADDGETTSATFDLITLGLEVEEELFFRVRKL